MTLALRNELIEKQDYGRAAAILCYLPVQVSQVARFQLVWEMLSRHICCLREADREALQRQNKLPIIPIQAAIALRYEASDPENAMIYWTRARNYYRAHQIIFNRIIPSEILLSTSKEVVCTRLFENISDILSAKLKT